MDRLIKAFEALVKTLTGDLFYAQQNLYSVVASNRITQTASLRSLDPARVPDLTEVAFSSPGLILELRPGTLVKVGYVSGTPYIAGYPGGALAPLVPGTGSGVLNKIDAGYVLITQVVNPVPAVVTAVYFPAGIAGGIAAQAALLVATTAGLAAFLLHLDGGRVTTEPWSVP